MQPAVLHHVGLMLQREMARYGLSRTGMTLNLEIADEETAMVSVRNGQVYLVLPAEFQGHALATNEPLTLGLTVHELGHVLDHDQMANVYREAAAEHPLLLEIVRWLVDIWNEVKLSRVRTFDRWLRVPRQICHDLGPDTSVAHNTVFSTLWEIRFSDPQRPWNSEVRPHYSRIVDTMLRRNTPWAVLQAAREIFRFLPQDMRQSQEQEEDTSGKKLHNSDEAAELANKPLAVVRAEPQLEKDTDLIDLERALLELHRAMEEVAKTAGPGDAVNNDIRLGKQDSKSVQKGKQLAMKLHKGWAERPVETLAVGIGKYNPRLEWGVYPPFEMEIIEEPTFPERFLLALDVSGSMWWKDEPIFPARRVAVAVVEAAQRLGVEVEYGAFSGHFRRAESLMELCSFKGDSTSIRWIMDVPGDHDILLITDAAVNLPTGWTNRHKRRVVMVFIGDTLPKAADQIARQVLHYDGRGLPLEHLVAGAARSIVVRE